MTRFEKTLTVVLAGVLAGFPRLEAGEALGQGCEPAWTPGLFEVPGTDGSVYALTVFPGTGGSGGAVSHLGSRPEAAPADGAGGQGVLYAGGTFGIAGGVFANNIAAWDGERWSAVGSGVDGEVQALAVFDDGGGAAIYAGGEFATAGGAAAMHVAKWDGREWSALGSGVNGTVRAMAVYDDGTGAALYVGGEFTMAGEIPCARIAKWDGTEWSAVGEGMDEGVYALTVFDDGTGSALYAGGGFTTAGGASASRIAKWDGTCWSALGSGMDNVVVSLAVFDPPGEAMGSELYAGGGFSTAGGVSTQNVAKWNGTAWTGASLGVVARALCVYDAPGEENEAGLYAVSPNYIYKWDGAAWTNVGEGARGGVGALAVHDDGTGAALYAGGWFSGPGSYTTANRVARWNGSEWSSVGEGIGAWTIYTAYVNTLAVFDAPGDAMGASLYAGGYFGVAGIEPGWSIAQWTGHGWSAVGGGLPDEVFAMEAYDDGTGSALYVGGGFFMSVGTTLDYIAKWDGTGWSSLGGGSNGRVNALAVFDPPGSDGKAELYAGGYFSRVGNATASHIAKWDGAVWSALGAGTNGVVSCMVEFDPPGEESQAALYVGGGFTQAGTVPVNQIAKWDGATWSALGSGVDGTVRALAVFDDGSGPALYVGGSFTTAGGIAANRIAKWDGTEWSAPGSGMNDWVQALAVFDDGSGPALYAGGYFTEAGGVPASKIAKWDGTQWQAVGSGMGDEYYRYVNALTVFDPPGGMGPGLYAGGGFATAGGVVSALVARWGCQRVKADLDGDWDVDGFDFLTFANCYNGSEREVLAACANAAADLEGDGDVDGFDFLTFANCYNGSDRAALCP